MIKADLHLHTCFSHGVPTPFETHALASSRGYEVIGFSEHSPRPKGYDYSNEYREQLDRHLEDYKNQVLALQNNAATNPSSCQVLLGMEIDWLEGEDAFLKKASQLFDFDYLLGSVHFIGNWGFDDRKDDWQYLSQEECDKIYEKYFKAWRNMIRSGLFDIAAHPDLIKIFSVERFHNWLDKDESRVRIKECLCDLKEQGMAMEISSAGLRKPCNEIYPAPVILQMAAELAIPVALASDAHNLKDFGYGFAQLEKVAASYDWRGQTIYKAGHQYFIPFT